MIFPQGTSTGSLVKSTITELSRRSGQQVIPGREGGTSRAQQESG